MTHLALLDVDDDGNSAAWGDHVSDEELRGGAADRRLSRRIAPRGDRRSSPRVTTPHDGLHTVGISGSAPADRHQPT